MFRAAKLPYNVINICKSDGETLNPEIQPTVFFLKPDSCTVKDPFINSGFQLETKNRAITNIFIGTHLSNEFLQSLNDFQKVNHFTSLSLIGSKDGLHVRMIELKERLGHPVPFYPFAFYPPVDYEELLEAWHTKPLWIIKAPALSRARYIRLAYSANEPAPKFPYVVEEYISPPFLITGRKFDIRIYAVVTSIEPLIFYFHNQGLILFATHLYDEKGDINDLKMHLTNYEINKDSKEFVECNESEEKVENSKWSLPFFWKYMESIGVDSKKLQKDVEEVATSTIIAGMCPVRNKHRELIKFKRKSSFEIFGIDILLDSNLKPYILEVNVSPGMHDTSELDKRVKLEVNCDMFNIVRILQVSSLEPKQYRGYFEHEKLYLRSKTEKRLSDVINDNIDPWENPTFADYTIVREFIEEQERKRGFHRAYPKKSNIHKYENYFDHYTYEDIVLNKWLMRDKQQRFDVLMNYFYSYSDSMTICRNACEVDPDKVDEGKKNEDQSCNIE
ncbi:hypothetical protein M9Y10_008756 [Tritrichomonas musculus]|uniref:Tubulin--tyrosine ligase-like protein 5 n=1 Tax=Tritrichomonas musculus TaxID=1915356 RepID=A0ABR2IZ04_9EUKA